jgi:hypothetical protein
VTLILTEEVEKLLVVLGRHIKVRHQQFVVAARVLESEPHKFTNVMSCEVARHEGFVDFRPERRAVVEYPIENHLRT